MLPRVVDENAPHYLRSNAKEVGSILPIHLLTDELWVSLIDQCGGLKGVVFALVAHAAMGQPM